MDRYFFDKRVIKKALIKYGLMFLIAAPILIGVNIALKDSVGFWSGTFIDVGILVLVIGVCSAIWNKIEQKRIAKAEEEAKRQKQLERARRRGKKQAKANKTNTPKVEQKVEEVEVITPDEK